MNLISEKRDTHLTEIVSLLSMYQTLSIFQLKKLYPELTKAKLMSFIRRLEKGGRLIYVPETDIVKYSRDCSVEPSVIAAFWVLLDFMPAVTYHTISDFPVSLTFYTEEDVYDVIYVTEGKEMLISHVLSIYPKSAPRRLIIINHTQQIPKLHFPGIAAFCIVKPDGQIQYYKIQGVTDS